MEWKNSMDGAISYPSENPGLRFLYLISSHPLSLHLPRLLRMYMYLCRPWSDLWLCGYRKRIKQIACMCSLFIANTNEKWAHPLPLGFCLLAHFLSRPITTSPFLTVKHLERVMVTTEPQERQVSAPLDHAVLEKTLRTRTTVSVHKILFMESTKYC